MYASTVPVRVWKRSMMAESDNGPEYVDVLRCTLAACQKIIEKMHRES